MTNQFKLIANSLTNEAVIIAAHQAMENNTQKIANEAATIAAIQAMLNSAEGSKEITTEQLVTEIAENYYRQPEGTSKKRVLTFNTIAKNTSKDFFKCANYFLSKILDTWKACGWPETFKVLELGAGNGDLMDAFLKLRNKENIDNMTCLAREDSGTQERFLKALKFCIFDQKNMIEQVQRPRFGDAVEYISGNLGSDDFENALTNKFKDVRIIYGNEIPDTQGVKIVKVEGGKVYQLTYRYNKMGREGHIKLKNVFSKYEDRCYSEMSPALFFPAGEVDVSVPLEYLKKLGKFRDQERNILNYVKHFSIIEKELLQKDIDALTLFSPLPTNKDGVYVDGDYIIHTGAYELFDILKKSGKPAFMLDYYDRKEEGSDLFESNTGFRVYSDTAHPLDPGRSKLKTKKFGVGWFHPFDFDLGPSLQLLYISALKQIGIRADVTYSPLIGDELLTRLGLKFVKSCYPESNNPAVSQSIEINTNER